MPDEMNPHVLLLFDYLEGRVSLDDTLAAMNHLGTDDSDDAILGIDEDMLDAAQRTRFRALVERCSGSSPDAV